MVRILDGLVVMPTRLMPNHQKGEKTLFPGPSPDFFDSDDSEGECKNHPPGKRVKQIETRTGVQFVAPGGKSNLDYQEPGRNHFTYDSIRDTRQFGDFD